MTVKERFSVRGLDCADCAQTLEDSLATLPDVVSSRVDFAAGTLEIEYNPSPKSRELVLDRARQLGYELVAVDERWAKRTGEMRFKVEDLDCPDCAVHLERAISALPGVAEVKLDFMAGQLRVVPEGSADIRIEVEARARELGYVLQLQSRSEAVRAPRSWRGWLAEHRRDISTAGAGFAIVLGLIGRGLGVSPAVSDAFFALAMVVGGFYVARAAWVGIRSTHSFDMNALMTLAALGAMAIGEFLEGAMVMFLFSLGNTLEGYTVDKARDAIRTLLSLAPREAIRLRDGREERVPVDQLAVGDIIVVRPGERISMDGVIVSGASFIDQAPVTGESMPVQRGAGDMVYAGTINGQGVLTLRIIRPASDNTIARIIRMVEEAQAQRAPTQRFVDVFARYYTPVVIGVALAVAVIPPILVLGPWQMWLYRALVLLVIGCPCALVISTPVSIVSAIASAARAGVLIKGGAYLEQLGTIRAMAFDKTGTLTRGQPEVVDARCAQHARSATDEDCHMCGLILTSAAAIESRSEHPLALAVVREAERRGLSWTAEAIEGVESLSGRGLRGLVNGQRVTVGSHKMSHENFDESPHDLALCDAVEEAQAAGGTVMIVDCSSCGVQGFIAVADTVRAEAPKAIAELKRLGIAHMIMLTGDNPTTAAAISQEVGVGEFRAELLPEEKVRAIEEIVAKYGPTAMVGDGINDAPALARATLGIAMGAVGSAAALETADVALMSDNLRRLPFAIRLGRHARRIIRQNIAFALFLKAIFFGLALAGLATLWMAVFADVGASMLVIFNGMRLLRVKPQD